MNRMLIIKTGCTAAEVRAEHGDYDRWFIDAMDSHGIGFDVVDVTRNPVPPADSYLGVIVTGATSAVYREEPWMGPMREFLRADAGESPPSLSVCFGAQLLAAAHGGSVTLNPGGWEIGRVMVDLTPEADRDPLFAGLPRSLSVLTTHEDRIETLPSHAVRLAGNDLAPVQAFRCGGSSWGVQFHPELTEPILEQLIRLRAGSLTADARAHGRDAAGHVERLIGDLHRPEPGHGRRVLDNFVSFCLGRGPATRPAG